MFSRHVREKAGTLQPKTDCVVAKDDEKTLPNKFEYLCKFG